MFNKIYSNIKKFIKENKIHILISTIFMSIVILGHNIHLPYYIEAPGGITDLSSKITANNEYKFQGSYNTTFIKEYQADLWKYLISKINSNLDAVPLSEYSSDNIKTARKRDKLLIYNSFSNAYFVSHNIANKKINIKNSNIYVIYITPEAKTNLEVGDKINKLDGKTIESFEEIKEYIDKKEIGDKIVVDTDNGEKFIEVINTSNKKELSIYLICNYEYDTDIKYNYDKNEYGSSGGLMMALSIYDYITPYDLTKGKKIAGTGTIELDGSVGAIDGVKYKIIAAHKNKADLFFIPEENYYEAKKVMEQRNYKFKLVSVKNIKDAIDYLNK